MDELLTLLETAKTERAATLREFVRLKKELALTQRRVDELRGENAELKQALHAAEHEVMALHSGLADLA